MDHVKKGFKGRVVPEISAHPRTVLHRFQEKFRLKSTYNPRFNRTQRTVKLLALHKHVEQRGRNSPQFLSVRNVT